MKTPSLLLYKLGGLIAAGYSIYYLLLKDNTSPYSIYTMLYNIHHFANNWHVLVVGLLPVYIAGIVFGLIALGLYLGSVVGQIVSRFRHSDSDELSNHP